MKEDTSANVLLIAHCTTPESARPEPLSDVTGVTRFVRKIAYTFYTIIPSMVPSPCPMAPYLQAAMYNPGPFSPGAVEEAAPPPGVLLRYFEKVISAPVHCELISTPVF